MTPPWGTSLIVYLTIAVGFFFTFFIDHKINIPAEENPEKKLGSWFYISMFISSALWPITVMASFVAAVYLTYREKK